jgi:3-dehydroquinate dehydratase / shikimate dehydrogenase
MRKKPSLPRICITATGDSPRELFECARRALGYSRFVELRLDWLLRPAPALALIPRLLESRAGSRRESVFLQATCRRAENGGRFRGTVAEQIEILRKAAEAGCRVVDIEIESAESAGREATESLRQQAALILSWHDFRGSPPLDAVARRLRRYPADYYKLVPTALRQTDNCAALELLGSAAGEARDIERWIVFSMEQAGIPSRVLALSRGSAFVYAACPPAPRGRREQEPAAPGQIDFETLRRVFRAEKLTPRTALYGLLGYPIGHSVGAAIHNAAFRAREMDAVYLPLVSSNLLDFREAARRYPLSGFSVTIPHKQSILRLLDRIDPVVRLAGAANTVRIRHGRWEAINSDVEGIVAPLRKAFRLSERGSLGKNFRAVVVGTGGAARAALVALGKLRCGEIFVTGRNQEKAANLARDLETTALAISQLGRDRFDLMIHATPVGMWPHTGECFLRPEQITASTVFDLVYNPQDTRLLQLARARGCRTISGLEMFIAQAARQFEYWTGQEAPRQLMRRTAEQQLERFAQRAHKRV